MTYMVYLKPNSPGESGLVIRGIVAESVQIIFCDGGPNTLAIPLDYDFMTKCVSIARIPFNNVLAIVSEPKLDSNSLPSRGV